MPLLQSLALIGTMSASLATAINPAALSSLRAAADPAVKTYATSTVNGPVHASVSQPAFVEVAAVKPSGAVAFSSAVKADVNANIADGKTHDQFRITNLKSTQTAGKGVGEKKSFSMSFEFEDCSTVPVQKTKCSVAWREGEQPHGFTKCNDEWMTAQIENYYGLKEFEIRLTHAYGEKCKDCVTEPYNGIVGSCAQLISRSNPDWEDSNGVASLKGEILCPVDFD